MVKVGVSKEMSRMQMIWICLPPFQKVGFEFNLKKFPAKPMDRRILFFLTESVWPSSAVPSQRTADSGRIDDGQTNSVLFD